jgi:hypothetical protein
MLPRRRASVPGLFDLSGQCLSEGPMGACVACGGADQPGAWGIPGLGEFLLSNMAWDFVEAAMGATVRSNLPAALHEHPQVAPGQHAVPIDGIRRDKQRRREAQARRYPRSSEVVRVAIIESNDNRVGRAPPARADALRIRAKQRQPKVQGLTP